ncbi:hypothetical protein [Pseudoalteromonas umbrosa]|uniref:hypothetical protein n=1 Tax=Pseudoalteromonas umbrosa TaxID=3048489 RepID=UPI0024C266D1|nr:hypothetical protein [Pseudoalteromonas sp. B95]MDK1290105.1 hypothetical protein [Pseudoalteromonas sp. B95]
MDRAISIVERYTELLERASTHKNPTPSNGVGNPYHGKNGRFVSAANAVVASKRPNALRRSAPPQRFRIDGWKDEPASDKNPKGLKIAKLKPANGPAGPQVCGRSARAIGLDIRCHDGKVMAGHTALGRAAATSRR